MGAASDPGLLVLHGLRLKGFAEAPVVAALFSLPEHEISGLLSSAADRGLVVHRQGRMRGWALTPAGRSENECLLAAELDTLIAAGVNRRQAEAIFRTYHAASENTADAEREALNAAIVRACASLDAGGGLPADEVVARLRRKS